MSTNQWDATINEVFPTDPGQPFELPSVGVANPYDVVAQVAIGKRLNEVVTSHTLSVSVVNLSQSNVVANTVFSAALTPQVNTPRLEAIRVSFAAPAGAAVGDVLQIVASYTVAAGVNTDTSSAQSDTFVVVA